jgi:8-oxo-dGTP diphosphatase
MAHSEHHKIHVLDFANGRKFTRACVGCLVVSRDGKIVLQQRDQDAKTFPGFLATFGGGIEDNETPTQALVRELKEELGADVKESEVIPLGVITESQTNFCELVHVFFWHDKRGTITGCYEGTARYYSHPNEAMAHPKIMDDVKWLLAECQHRKLL